MRGPWSPSTTCRSDRQRRLRTGSFPPMLKWKLMLGIIPIVGLVVGIRQILRYAFGFEGLIEFSDVSVVLSGGVFLLGFMLAGTISDYKEAEKLPGEIVAGL